MRLRDLNPKWLDYGGGERVDGSKIPFQKGIGLSFECPKCMERCYLEFDNPLDGSKSVTNNEQKWHRNGDDWDFLTLTPSIVHDKPDSITIMPDHNSQCGWHGYIRNGEVIDA